MGVADDSTEEHSHLPAVEDWPRGFGEASWWPFVTAAGATGLYVGAGLYFLGHGGSPPIVPQYAGPAVFIGAMLLFLVGLYGWVYHAFVASFWQHGGHDGSTLRWGMSLFLVTEVATFGAGFIYYFFVRTDPIVWPPTNLPEHLLSTLVLVNTALLIASSFTMHWAHVELRRENRRNFILGLVVTLALGTVFIAGQVYEYFLFIAEEGFTITSGVFASAFFALTGLHGLHVTMGAILIAILLIRALLGQYSADRDISVTTVSMYWHFVDAVWIFLVVVIYFGASI